MARTLEVGSAPKVGPRIIKSSSVKASLYLLGSLVFVAGGVLMVRDPASGGEGWLCLAFFGLCALVFAWLLLRPQLLVLEVDGFTVTGGLVRSPKKVLWRDMQGFFVYRAGRGGKMIGYNLEPHAKTDSVMGKVASALGADAALPKGWPGSPDRMVEDLNAYRRWALNLR